ncbi:Alpha/Beta hydrolase protein [Tricharina praecox]|uniref:Alpha/Beta hydrolase protein n=1 Tax=Tricharina praecox TaxID=43433 RepID=UPI00221F5B3D|nr:Alpha/Beta hydrolase protein [Tricharina praecox]KAI5853303.1 Alpha/Beta hydrolase protein [Tricharina praecox]
MMKSSISVLTVVLAAAATAVVAAAPSVRLSGSNTVYEGVHIPSFDQEAFLGVPYASQPVRFTPSRLLVPGTGRVSARTYGTSCPAYGSATTEQVTAGIITLGEDCLNLNVVRPTGENGPLPVAVWIYGGGWQQGSAADLKYNLSHIVQQSVEMGKPMIGVSINYRTAGFGFLYSQEVQNSGNANLGLKDQRVALQWIQKYIHAFGGDPKKVTIWGESAGAYSIGNHLLAYGGRDDGLFRGAILQSGTAVGPPLNDTRWYQPIYNRVTAATGCADAIDTLDCLRNLPYATLYPALNVGVEWFAAVDGDMIGGWGSAGTNAGRFIKVPLLLGSNTDEGTSFGVSGVNSDADAVAQLISSKRWVLTPVQASKLLTFYPDDPIVGSPYGTGSRTFPALGAQYKRYSSMAGDLTMDAPRRQLAQAAAKYSAVFSYRFDTPPPNSTEKVGIGHGAEVPFVFADPTASLGNGTAVNALARKMARLWVAFVVDGRPAEEAAWPRYRNERPRNLVLRADRSYTEEDTYRREGMAYINSLLR